MYTSGLFCPFFHFLLAIFFYMITEDIISGKKRETINHPYGIRLFELAERISCRRTRGTLELSFGEREPGQGPGTETWNREQGQRPGTENRDRSRKNYLIKRKRSVGQTIFEDFRLPGSDQHRE